MFRRRRAEDSSEDDSDTHEDTDSTTDTEDEDDTRAESGHPDQLQTRDTRPSGEHEPSAQRDSKDVPHEGGKQQALQHSTLLPTSEHPQRTVFYTTSQGQSTMHSHEFATAQVSSKHPNKPVKTKHRKINKEHPEFELTYDMMLGIRYTVSRAEAHPLRRDLHPEAFKEYVHLRFPGNGSATTPAHQARDFKFKDYMPEVFRNIRARFDIDPAEYLLCICGNFNFLEFISNSKSGQFFFYSHDRRYMIKTISQDESKFLRKIMPQYYEHVMKYPNTLLARFFGMHRVKPHKRPEHHFLIMGSVFSTRKTIDRVYDLKGSTHGRRTNPEERTRPGCVFKDNDFLEDNAKILLGPELTSKFLEQLRIDVELLTRLGIMDYSLLLGVHNGTMYRRNLRLSGISVGIPGLIPVSTRNESISIIHPSASVASHGPPLPPLSENTVDEQKARQDHISDIEVEPSTPGGEVRPTDDLTTSDTTSYLDPKLQTRRPVDLNVEEGTESPKMTPRDGLEERKAASVSGPVNDRPRAMTTATPSSAAPRPSKYNQVSTPHAFNVQFQPSPTVAELIHTFGSIPATSRPSKFLGTAPDQVSTSLPDNMHVTVVTSTGLVAGGTGNEPILPVIQPLAVSPSEIDLHAIPEDPNHPTDQGSTPIVAETEDATGNSANIDMSLHTIPRPVRAESCPTMITPNTTSITLTSRSGKVEMTLTAVTPHNQDKQVILSLLTGQGHGESKTWDESSGEVPSNQTEGEAAESSIPQPAQLQQQPSQQPSQQQQSHQQAQGQNQPQPGQEASSPVKTAPPIEVAHSIFTQFDGGVAVRDECGNTTGQTLYFGIIDILTHYGAKKWFENKWKSLWTKEEISAVAPDRYGQRFLNFIQAATQSNDQKE